MWARRLWRTDKGMCALCIGYLLTYSAVHGIFKYADYRYNWPILPVMTWELLREFPREGPRRPGVPATFSPDGALVAIGIAQSRVRLMRVEDWSTLADLAGPWPGVK